MKFISTCSIRFGNPNLRLNEMGVIGSDVLCRVGSWSAKNRDITPNRTAESPIAGASLETLSGTEQNHYHHHLISRVHLTPNTLVSTTRMRPINHILQVDARRFVS